MSSDDNIKEAYFVLGKKELKSFEEKRHKSDGIKERLLAKHQQERRICKARYEIFNKTIVEHDRS